LRHHHKLKFELVSARSGQAMRVRVIDQTEIDRLYHEGVLSQIEHSTAEKFRRDLWLIGVYGRQTSEVGGRVLTREIGAIAKAASEAMARLHVAIRVLDREVGERARRQFTAVMVDNRRVFDVPTIRACLAALLPLVEGRRVREAELPWLQAFGLAPCP
jgi:hypothetical protein